VVAAVIWLVLGLFIAALIVLAIRKGWQNGEKPLDPAAATRAAIDLHAISRKLAGVRGGRNDLAVRLSGRVEP
jgi:hypothetical protein